MSRSSESWEFILIGMGTPSLRLCLSAGGMTAKQLLRTHGQSTHPGQGLSPLCQLLAGGSLVQKSNFALGISSV